MISAHKNESQLVRLIEHLKVDFDIYLNIDKSSKINMRSYDNVYVYKNVKVEHGGFSQILSTINLMKVAHKNNYDRYIFISGQCVPIKSNEYIKTFFSEEKNKNKEFLECKEICSSDGVYKDMCRRMNTYNFGFWYRKFTHQSLRMSVSNLPMLKRSLAKNMYYGSNWFNITNDALSYILDYIKENKSYVSRFRYTWGGDELFFNTILMNSHLKENCESQNVLRYQVWKGGVPNILLIKDYDEFMKSSAIFARKFDDKIDSHVIDKVYSNI